MLPLKIGNVRQTRRIGRVNAVVRCWQRQLGGKSSGRRHGEKLRRVRGAVARRTEQHVLAVRRPSDGHIRGGMPGQALRNASGDRHHVHIYIAVILPGERDLRAVRRKMCAALVTTRREPLRLAAVAAHHPDIARIAEGNLRPAQRGIAKEVQLVLLSARERNRPSQKDRESENIHERKNQPPQNSGCCIHRMPPRSGIGESDARDRTANSTTGLGMRRESP